MRGFVLILVSAAALTIVAGVLAIVSGFPGPASDGEIQAGLALPAATTGGEASLTQQPVANSSNGAAAGTAVLPTVQISQNQVDLPEINVQKPSMELLTTGLARFQAQYSEQYQVGNVKVAWRPGAYKPELADHIAALTTAAVDEVSGKIHETYSGPVEIFLADQLFAEDCFGCQGFTAADLHAIFLLKDGSVADDEFDALLVHEVTHLIAAQKIALPHSLFFAEGLATWSMSADLVSAGYIAPLQTAAWIYRAGAMPSLESLLHDDFAGRMRKRVSYDAASSFASFVIDTYGWADYRRLYGLEPPENVLNKDWDALESEWHSYLDQFADTQVNSVGADAWWASASQVIAGFGRFYEDTSSASADQYKELTLSRLALNRGYVDAAIQHLNASGFGFHTAQ